MARVCQLTDDPSGPTVQADCYEGLFWKSHATAELVAKMENAKYVLHQPFNRQIKKMAQDGFPMAAATMDDWHQAACVAKTEHSHPLGMVVSTHFRCGKGVKRGLKNGALPFKID